MAIVLNVSCLWCRQRERTHTLLVALFVIRGYLGFLRPSRSSSTLWSLLRGWSVSLLVYFVKNWTWVIVFEGWRVFFGNVNMAKDSRTSLVYQHTTAEKCGTRSTLEVKIYRGRIIVAWLTAWKYLEWYTVFILFLHVWIACLNSEDDLFFVKQE